MIVISQVNGIHPSWLDIKSKRIGHIFIFARKSTDVRCEMFIAIHINKPVHNYEFIVLDRR